MKPEIGPINYLLASSLVGSAVILGVASERDASPSEAQTLTGHTLSIDQVHIPVYPFPKIAVLKPAAGETPDMDFGHTSEFQDYAFDSVYRQELEQEAEDARIKEEEKLIAQSKNPTPIELQKNVQTPLLKVNANKWPSSLEPCGGDLPPCNTAKLESGGDYSAVNPTGCNGLSCGGKWQFAPPTWNDYGGYHFAQDAPPEMQDQRAREVWDGGRGCQHWNACGH